MCLPPNNSNVSIYFSKIQQLTNNLKLMQNTAFLLVSHTAVIGVPKLMEVNLTK